MQGYKRAIAAVMCAVLALLVPTQALAAATVTSYASSCGTFSATGTTDAAFVVFYVYNRATGNELYWSSFPAIGAFSHTVTFDPAFEGTRFNLEVWGSPTSDPNDWDEGAYFDVDVNCSGGAAAVPALSPWTLGALSVLLAGMVAVVGRRRLGVSRRA